MEVALAVAPTCVVQIAEASFRPSPEGWTETTHLEIVADPWCGTVAFSLPPGGVLGAHRARQRLGDGTGRRLGEERWELLPRAIDGSGWIRLHVPELRSGDRVLVDLERELPPGPVGFRPGPARFVSVELEGRGTVTGPAGARTATDGRIWTADAPVDYRVVLDDGAEEPAVAPRRAPGEVRIAQRLTLIVPEGDPQIALYPGGGSSVVVEQFLEFCASDQELSWPLELPSDAEIALGSEPRGAAFLERDPGGSRLVVLPSEARTRVSLRWEQPDAPTYGERPPGVDQLTVDAPGGEIRREGDGWSLVGVNGRPVLPSRESLIQALDRRFRMAAIPEPGAPFELRGASPSWELGAELRPSLLRRVAVGDWPADPLWPRKLVRARRSGALTPTEAALTLWLHARQLGFDADWALVRPATAGEGYDAAPAGYGSALVRISLGDQSRWIDPGCAVCGPFELPPELEGASALGAGIDRTPPPTVGRQEVEIRPDTVRWRLEGPPALELRRWLATLPASDRSAALAAHVGGPSSTLLEVQGVETAGAPISVAVTRGHGLSPNPLLSPPPDPSGTVWFGWIGDRVVRWTDPGLEDASMEAGPLSWTRVRTPEGLVETLSVTERRVSAEDVARIEIARRVEPPP